MESIDTFIDKDVNGRKVSEYCLGLSTILRKLLKYFSNAELIKLSLVSKSWNFEARSLLRRRGTLSARIGPGAPHWIISTPIVHPNRRDPCQYLMDFSLDLESMRVVPFSGIDIFIYHGHSCRLPSNGALNPAYKIILDRLPWKNLIVRFPRGGKNCKNCPAFGLVQKILEDHGGELERLSVDCEVPTLFENFPQSQSLACLKTLIVVTRYSVREEHLTDAIIKQLVSSAPNLEEIVFTDMYRNVYFEENFLKSSSAVLVPDFTFCPLCEQVCEGLVGSLRLTDTEIFTSDEDLGVGLLRSYVPMVLEASRTSLLALTMDLLFAVPLMCYGICLENVTLLEIEVNDWLLQLIEPPIWALIRNLDFTRLFPKLQEVSIQDHYSVLRHFSSDKIGAFIKQGKNSVRTIFPDRAINIKHLELNVVYSDLHSVLPELAQMFPHVQKLSALTRRAVYHFTPPFPFTLLWENFAGLQELHITHAHESSRVSVENLDSVFCGIFHEEVAALMKEDDEYLRAVNLVPVMPSIRCMTSLRSFTFRLIVISTESDPWKIEYHPSFWFSKVSGLIGFSRCPGLTVTFQATTPYGNGQALGHTRSYVLSYATNVDEDDRDLP